MKAIITDKHTTKGVSLLETRGRGPSHRWL